MHLTTASIPRSETKLDSRLALIEYFLNQCDDIIWTLYQTIIGLVVLFCSVFIITLGYTEEWQGLIELLSQ